MLCAGPLPYCTFPEDIYEKAWTLPNTVCAFYNLKIQSKMVHHINIVISMTVLIKKFIWKKQNNIWHITSF